MTEHSRDHDRPGRETRRFVRTRSGATTRTRRVDETGASMVELAIVIALFITMSLAIMEFTFAFAQNNEINHAAREGARAAAVGCDGVAAANASLSILDPADVSVVVVNGTPTADAGSTGTVHLSTTYQPITGFFDAMIGGASLTSDLTFYAERILPGSGAGC